MRPKAHKTRGLDGFTMFYISKVHDSHPDLQGCSDVLW